MGVLTKDLRDFTLGARLVIWLVVVPVTFFLSMKLGYWLAGLWM